MPHTAHVALRDVQPHELEFISFKLHSYCVKPKNKAAASRIFQVLFKLYCCPRATIIRTVEVS